MYDCIVIGAGHAGCEASFALKKLNKKVLLLTSELNNIATLPCNPSIGGPAKGILVREIDALGGLMGIVADKTFTQMKLLNTSKGPAVRALRAQVDKDLYPKLMKDTLIEKGIEIKEGTVDNLLIENDEVKGIFLDNKELIKCKSVILCTGTYLDSYLLYGDSKVSSGPDGFKHSTELSKIIKKYHSTQRLKTGTPPRITLESIDYNKLDIHDGDSNPRSFSYKGYKLENKKQLPSYLTYTTEKTHEIINNNLDKSPMYSGMYNGVGPRYCPSIEDKVRRFSDKNRHQVFLEQEYFNKDVVYVQGFSTSMPKSVQKEMLESIIGLDTADILEYGYAIEYDSILSSELYPSLESKFINNLYFAGQVNGTSGYEEAACQGLIAGINVARKLNNQEIFTLKRSEAYIGVLIDDLVYKGTKEPYRMLTSRAEHRLLLRHDNADIRLSKIAYELGLITESDYKYVLSKIESINKAKDILINNTLLPNKEINNLLSIYDINPIKNKITSYELLKRPELTIQQLKNVIQLDFNDEILELTEIDIKYEGYIKKAIKQSDKQLQLDNLKIPDDINYDDIHNLALEAKEKLKQFMPQSLGQASRISGVNPSDISMLLIYINAR